MVDVSNNSLKSATLEAFGLVKRQLNLIATQKLKSLGIGTKQCLFIRRLMTLKTASLADLSRLTQTDPGATTRAVEALLKNGWVEQVDCPGDKRRWELSLSKKGLKLAQSVDEIYQDTADLLTQALSVKEQVVFLGLLNKIQIYTSDLPVDSSRDASGANHKISDKNKNLKKNKTTIQAKAIVQSTSKIATRIAKERQ